MPTRLLSACLAALVAAGFLAGSPRASAEFLSLEYEKKANNTTLTVYRDGVQYTPFAVGPFYWHDTNIPPNASFPDPVVTFCIEIDASQPLPTAGQAVEFRVTDPGAATNALKELYGDHYNTAWNSSSFTGSPESIAFQIAIWELIYDGASPGSTTSLAEGRFRVDPAVLASGPGQTAQGWLAGISGDASSFASQFAGSELVALQAPAGPGAKQPGDQFQDHITVTNPIPAPPGAVLAGVGFVALLGRSLRRKAPTA